MQITILFGAVAAFLPVINGYSATFYASEDCSGSGTEIDFGDENDGNFAQCHTLDQPARSVFGNDIDYSYPVLVGDDAEGWEKCSRAITEIPEERCMGFGFDLRYWIGRK